MFLLRPLFTSPEHTGPGDVRLLAAAWPQLFGDVRFELLADFGEVSLEMWTTSFPSAVGPEAVFIVRGANAAARTVDVLLGFLE